MLGLVIKNLLQIKHVLRVRDAFLLGGLVIVTFFIMPQYASMMISAVVLFAVSGYSNTIVICDAQTQWNEYESVLPVTVAQRVQAKYLFGLGILFGMFVLLGVINFLTCIFLKVPYYFDILLIIFLFSYLQILITIPCNIKKDKESGSFVWGLFLVAVLILYCGSKYFNSSLLEILLILNNKALVYGLIPISLIIGTLISYRNAVKNLN